jgi:hypothetical protein
MRRKTIARNKFSAKHKDYFYINLLIDTKNICKINDKLMLKKNILSVKLNKVQK